MLPFPHHRKRSDYEEGASRDLIYKTFQKRLCRELIGTATLLHQVFGQDPHHQSLENMLINNQ